MAELAFLSPDRLLILLVIPLLVAAYIFAMLSGIYIGTAIEPDH